MVGYYKYPEGRVLLKACQVSQLVFNATVSGAPEPEYHHEIITGDFAFLNNMIGL